MESIDLENGKYTVINDNGKMSALRYGEPWRDLVGDNLIYFMMIEIVSLREKIKDQESAVRLDIDSPTARDAIKAAMQADREGS